MPEYRIDVRPNDGPIGFVVETIAPTRQKALRQIREAFESDEPYLIAAQARGGARLEVRVYFYSEELTVNDVIREQK